MATGDITSVAIRSDGWSADVTIEGFTSGATYDFGTLDDSPATVDSPTFTMTVVSEGYNSSGVLGTVTRTVYGTHVVRKAYPNNASLDEDTSTTPGSLIVRVALSDSVYNDDKNGGAGTSGTNPTVTISAGWCVNTGGASQSSVAATNLACTNNSTLDYPKVIAQWAWGHTKAWRRLEADFTIGCIAYHGHGVAAVTLSAVGATSLVSTSGTKTSKTDHTMTASGLHYESYDLAVTLSGYTQGETINLNYIAYPTVGDADSIIDTSTNTTSTDNFKGFTQIQAYCNKTGALKNYAIVDPVSGNDTTGAPSAVEATARTTPYLTIGAALDDDADWILVKTGGTPDWLGSTPVSVTQKDYMIEVLPDGGSVTLTRDSTWKQPKAKRLLYRGFSFTCASASGYLDGNSVSGCHHWFENNTFSNSVNNTTGNSYRAEGCWYINNTWNQGREFIRTFSTARSAYVVVGNNFAGAGQGISACNSTVANSISGAVAVDTIGVSAVDNASNPAGLGNNIIILNNKLMGAMSSASKVFSIADGHQIDNCAVIGNVIEAKSGTQPVFWVAADNHTQSIINCVVAHNTAVGERSNLFYNDVGTVANVRQNIFVRNNAFRGFNIKSDLFGTPDGNRIGNWAQVNGVNFSDNRYDGTDGSSFIGDYRGINVAFVNAADGVYGQMGYTDEQSLDLGGAGNGNYLPAAGSALKSHTLRVKYQSYDMNGTAV